MLIINAFNNHLIMTDLSFILSQNISGCCIPPESSISESQQEFIFYEITEEDVHQLLSSLSPTEASGLDALPANIIKLTIPYITKSLTTILNRAISAGIFPRADLA